MARSEKSTFVLSVCIPGLVSAWLLAVPAQADPVPADVAGEADVSLVSEPTYNDTTLSMQDSKTSGQPQWVVTPQPSVDASPLVIIGNIEDVRAVVTPNPLEPQAFKAPERSARKAPAIEFGIGIGGAQTRMPSERDGDR